MYGVAIVDGRQPPQTLSYEVDSTVVRVSAPKVGAWMTFVLTNVKRLPRSELRPPLSQDSSIDEEASEH